MYVYDTMKIFWSVDLQQPFFSSFFWFIRYRRLDVEERVRGTTSFRHRAARISPVKDTEGILCTLGDRHYKEYPIYRDNESDGSTTLCTGMYHLHPCCDILNISFETHWTAVWN